MRDVLIKANDYDIRLEDESIFSFWRSELGNELKYSWYESSQTLPSYEDFARQYLSLAFQHEMADELAEEWLEGFGTDIHDAYEEEVKIAPLREAVTPIRYEYNEDQYTPGVHPASHLHIGINNDIRMACRRLLTPLSFVLLVLRQGYPKTWKRLLANGEVGKRRAYVRDALEFVDGEYWQDYDSCEMWLE
jgi:hypothetical protein